MNDPNRNAEADAGAVECLGLRFKDDEQRRQHFLDLLAKKLQDPSFRKQEGFPRGTDQAILAMSDPPYYTACPNPWLSEFVKQYGKQYDPKESYRREPLAIDVSVGKADAIYKAHSYHTKVPHLAIVPSILHYTEPNGLVLDGFAGSGMTGVAAQWCGIAPDVYRHEVELAWKKQGRPPPNWGRRRVVLSELSPAATSISAGYNFPSDIAYFERRAKQMLESVRADLGWMYQTRHEDGQFAHINYMVWSEVFTCRNCAGELVFFDEAFDKKTSKVRDQLHCPRCRAIASKEQMDLVFESFQDGPHARVDTRPKRVPVLINYSIGKRTLEKRPDKNDLDVLKKIAALGVPDRLPTDELPDCQMTRVGRMRTTNTKCVHHMYMPRAGLLLARLWQMADEEQNPRIKNLLRFWLDSQFVNMSILNRYRPEVSFPYNPLTGVFYVPSLISEADPFTAYTNKIKRLVAAFRTDHAVDGSCAVSTGSATAIPIPNESVDYVFTDPPFGENIYYADLNFLIEAWHRVFTRVDAEAIIDRVRGKGLVEYQRLMHRCFAAYFRVLKPGRWMTVVFSNSRASVWNAIQLSLQQAGFVVAEVSALDKQQGSFKQVTSATAVKQDLVISAYKPNGGLEERFRQRGATSDSAWDFVETHLRQLAVTKMNGAELEFIVERDPRRIYDRLVAWFVRHDAPVPISSNEFVDGIRQRFSERDGMVFLDEQIANYDRRRAQVSASPQMELFVSDERSAIDWLTEFLKRRPSTYQEIHPEFITQLGAGWKKHETKPELSALLEDNFLKYDGGGDVPSQIHSYLSTNYKDVRGLEKSNPRLIAKAKERWYVPDPSKGLDLEKKRERALLKEFAAYMSTSGRRLKEFRLEVLRAGFKDAWSKKDYQTIIKVAERIPEEALQEDEKLLLWYDQALTRAEAGG